jgi:RNA-binding protein
VAPLRIVNAALKRELRGRAHSLKPVLVIADRGLEESVLAEAERALEHHELIKVKIRHDRDARALLTVDFCERVGAALIQSVGQIITVYKPRPETSAAAPAGAHSKSGDASRNSSARSSAGAKAWDTATHRKRSEHPGRGSRRRSD